jgi:hypothetical protein
VLQAGEPHVTMCCRLVSYMYPARNKELVEQLAAKHATVVGVTNTATPAADHRDARILMSHSMSLLPLYRNP